MQIKIISSLEKCFFDETPETKASVSRLSSLKNEILSFQLAIYSEGNSPVWTANKLGITGALKPFMKLYKIEHVPSQMPDYPGSTNPCTLRYQPGLFPDLLQPVDENELVYVRASQLLTYWVELDLTEAANAGLYNMTFAICGEDGNEKCAASIIIEILNASLPAQTTKVTQWFHCDCLAVYYHLDAFSEEHWRVIGNFLRTAVKYGINLILTPILTPPLDTLVGGERPTMQLVDVTVTDGKYSFGYEKLDRWFALCDECGVKFFEMAHLFTQWGVEHAPKVMATVDGEYKRIFGWETDSVGEEYSAFIKRFLHELIAHLKTLGVADRCLWHISDEPGGHQIEKYLAARAIVKPELGEYQIMDALSDYDFYEKGATDIPIPSMHSVGTFIDHETPNLWTYYCCRPSIALKTSCTRIHGAQFYKYNIVGFLEWGYNFWFDCYSRHAVDPFRDTTGNFFVPSGDNFTVYPAPDGGAWNSIRLLAFNEALQDQRALTLLESLYGRDFVISLIDGQLEKPLTFGDFPHDGDYTLTLRQRVNALIKEKL